MPKETHLLKEAYRKVYAKKEDEEVIEEAVGSTTMVELSADEINRLLHGLVHLRPVQALENGDHTRLKARLEEALQKLQLKSSARELTDDEKLQDYLQGGKSVPPNYTLNAWRTKQRLR